METSKRITSNLELPVRSWEEVVKIYNHKCRNFYGMRKMNANNARGCCRDAMKKIKKAMLQDPEIRQLLGVKQMTTTADADDDGHLDRQGHVEEERGMSEVELLHVKITAERDALAVAKETKRSGEVNDPHTIPFSGGASGALPNKSTDANDR